jgi:hypothetical protein
MAEERSESNTFGIIAIICGIIGFFIFGLILGIVAVILGYYGRQRDANPTWGLVGLILGIIAIAGWAVAFFLL